MLVDTGRPTTKTPDVQPYTRLVREIFSSVIRRTGASSEAYIDMSSAVHTGRPRHI